MPTPRQLARRLRTSTIVSFGKVSGHLSCRQARELQIDHCEWTPDQQQDARLVLVSVEAASQPSVIKYARSLIDDQRLDRIVLDECHLTIMAADYRDSVVELRQIRSLRTQFVYLTATLLPSMQAEIEERNLLHHPTVVRASTNRPNMFYTVQQVSASQGTLLNQVATNVCDAWPSPCTSDQDKALLYTRNREEATALAALLDCDVYLGGHSSSNPERATFLQQWTEDPRLPLLVATTALAEGFDYHHVRLAAMVDELKRSDGLCARDRPGRSGRNESLRCRLPSRCVAGFFVVVHHSNRRELVARPKPVGATILVGRSSLPLRRLVPVDCAERDPR